MPKLTGAVCEVATESLKAAARARRRANRRPRPPSAAPTRRAAAWRDARSTRGNRHVVVRMMLMLLWLHLQLVLRLLRWFPTCPAATALVQAQRLQAKASN